MPVSQIYILNKPSLLHIAQYYHVNPPVQTTTYILETRLGILTIAMPASQIHTLNKPSLLHIAQY